MVAILNWLSDRALYFTESARSTLGTPGTKRTGPSKTCTRSVWLGAYFSTFKERKWPQHQRKSNRLCLDFSWCVGMLSLLSIRILCKSQSIQFLVNLKVICTCDCLWVFSFFKSWNCTRRSGSCNFRVLKSSLVQINSKLNSKLYDYLY